MSYLGGPLFKILMIFENNDSIINFYFLKMALNVLAIIAITIIMPSLVEA